METMLKYSDVFLLNSQIDLLFPRLVLWADYILCFCYLIIYFQIVIFIIVTIISWHTSTYFLYCGIFSRDLYFGHD